MWEGRGHAGLGMGNSSSEPSVKEDCVQKPKGHCCCLEYVFICGQDAASFCIAA